MYCTQLCNILKKKQIAWTRVVYEYGQIIICGGAMRSFRKWYSAHAWPEDTWPFPLLFPVFSCTFFPRTFFPVLFFPVLFLPVPFFSHTFSNFYIFIFPSFFIFFPVLFQFILFLFSRTFSILFSRIFLYIFPYLFSFCEYGSSSSSHIPQSSSSSHRVREMCQSCQTWPAKFGQIFQKTDTRLVFCNRILMRTDIFFTRITKPICNFANSAAILTEKIKYGKKERKHGKIKIR